MPPLNHMRKLTELESELDAPEDAETGKSLGWPPRPLVLHGSFDRLPLDNGTERR